MPLNALVNAPSPVSSLVLGSAVVGFAANDPQTPRSVTGEPPSEVTVPPLVAVVAVRLLITVVVTVGAVGVVKTTSSPYDVPTLLVA